jgi:hypothetical protein
MIIIMKTSSHPVLTECIIGVFMVALCLVVGCDMSQTRSQNQKDVKRTTLAFGLNDVTLVGKDGKVIAKKERVNSSSISPQEVIPFLKEYRDLIEAIDVANYLEVDNQADVDHFFALVKSLPHLKAFYTSLMAGLDEPALWRQAASIKGLLEVSLPWEDEAISLVARNSPEVKTISFPTMHVGALSNKGIGELAKLGRLEEIVLLCDLDTAEPISQLLRHAEQGFSSLRELSFQYENSDVFFQLAKNFSKFKNLSKLTFPYAQEKTLANLFKEGVESFRKKLISLKIDGLIPLSRDLVANDELVKHIAALDLKHLDLRWSELNDRVYELLEPLQTLETLAIQIPASKSIDVIKRLIVKLPNLKEITLTKIPGGTINGKKTPSQTLEPADLERLRSLFPKIRVVAQ